MVETRGEALASAPERSRSRSSVGRKHDDGDDQIQLLAHVFVAVSIVYSPIIAFCWRLIIISLYFTYYYFIFTYRFLLDITRRRTRPFEYLWKAVFHCIILASLTSWCISITPFHVIMPTLMDLFAPYTVHSVHRATEIMYDAGNSAEIDIIAIHGLGSNPDSAWTYKRDNGTEVNWLRDLLPTAEGLHNVRVVKVNHQTRWDSNVAELGLHEHASELLEHIQSIHKANPRRPIVFIAHSFGGLLLKKALIFAKARSKDVAAMTKGIIFLGVPHQGSNAAIFASCLSCMAFFRGSSSYLLELMAVNGPSLLDLESEFYDAYVMQYHSEDTRPYICDILERRPERIGNLALGPVVSPNHFQLRHGRLLALDTDHRGLNKFHSHDDPNFQTFLMVLWQAYEHALQNSRLLEREFPPPMAPTADEVSTNDLVMMAVPGPPWAKTGMLTTAGLYGLEELVASWLAKDRNRDGNYFTSRVPKMAVYGALIHVPLRDAIKWVLHMCFSGHTSLASQALQILIINLLVRNKSIRLSHRHQQSRILPLCPTGLRY
ncbi:hypothetical protein K449DRAFT_52541 [Hypoxylon sp. EC38]|nr:hypothetical protein K449DRAFT_52541 [Hypoxylon sp. EC38]